MQILVMILTLPGRIRRKSLPDLLHDLDPGVARMRSDETFMKRTVKIVDLLLDIRLLRRYGRCFLRSLTLFRFLRLQGWPVGIHFGVRKLDDAGSDITGHSWLVLDGEPFLEEDQAEVYTTTYSYPDTDSDWDA